MAKQRKRKREGKRVSGIRAGVNRQPDAAIEPVPQQLGKGVFRKEQAVDPDSGRLVRRYRNLGGWPPDLLHKHYGTIGLAMYDACYRFSRDFHLSGLMPRVSISAMPSSSGRSVMSDRTAIAMKEWGDALRAIKGESGQRIAVDVICHGYTPSDLLKPSMEGEVMQFTQWERDNIFRNRHAVIGRFIEACNDLREHYGFQY